MKQYVIIGNGVAAATCIEGIRSVDGEGKITVVSAEKYPVYCRPLISYLLEGKTDTERMNYRPADFYESNGCTVLYGKTATAIDSSAKTVTLDDGAVLPYDELCVATGSSPFVPPFAGLDTVEKKFTFMTLDDAQALEAAVTPESRVLIIGAGLIGLKCAEGIHGLVKEITVCDLADRVLSSILDTDGATFVQNHLESNGIRFLLSDSADHFEGNTAVMKSGETVPFDVLVLAIGVRANVGLVREIGGEVGRGIVVDDRMKTSVEHVYSAGDCTEGYDVTFGGKRVLALLPNATNQGFCAGVNMAGGDKTFEKPMPLNAIGFFGLHMMTAGTRYGSKQGGECYEERTEGSIKRLFTRGDTLTGFILIGETTRAGIYTSMIREQTPISSVNFELLKKLPTSTVYSQNKRRQMFGGVV